MINERSIIKRKRSRKQPELAVKPTLVHYWWAIVLFSSFFISPIIALSLWGRTPRLGVGLTSWFLIVIIVVAVGLMLLLPTWTGYRKVVYELYTDGMQVDVEPYNVKNQPWRKRWSAFVYAMTRLEFFGWVIWVTAVLAGITNSFKSMQLSAPLSTWERYLAALNMAATDLILASIIGSIVLFFIKLLEQYQDAIIESQFAAAASQSAAESATDAVAKAQTITPALAAQVKKTLDIFETTSNVLEVDTLSHRLAASLKSIAESDTALAQVRELSSRMVTRISQISQEITYSYASGTQPNEMDTFDLVSLSALYTTYLKVETLTFEGETGEVGRRGCRLSTRYPHYALTVRSVVEALHALDPNRYSYYTIFNRSPLSFFNPERPDVNPIANMSWTALFLEKFCRWHHEQDIGYQRYFVTVDENEDRGRVPPINFVTRGQLGGYYILCNIKHGIARPVLWGEAAKVLKQPDAWTEFAGDDMKAMPRIALDILPSQKAESTLCSLDIIQKLANPAYVILDSEDMKKVEQAIQPDLTEMAFKPLRDILLTYHSQTTPPRVLKFDSWDQYEDFFGQQIPRDLLAIRDNTTSKWCLCIGSIMGESDPTAVEMIYMTEKRQLKHLSWDLLTEKLSALFLSEEGVITRDLI